MTGGNAVVFLGPSGSGKTTTIAKMATRYALDYGAQNIMLATTDIYRVGAREQLRSYARILGIPIRTINNKEEYQELLDLTTKDKLVLIDTAGLSFNDEKYQEQFELLTSVNKNTLNCLVMSTTEHFQGLAHLINSYMDVGIDFCIPTKLDEATSLGGLLSVVIEKSLAIASICDGQKVPEDMHDLKPYELVTRVVSRANKNKHKFDEEHLEQTIGHYECEHGLEH